MICERILLDTCFQEIFGKGIGEADETGDKLMVDKLKEGVFSLKNFS